MFKLLFAISGASGIPVAQYCLSEMAQMENISIHLIISSAAKKVMEQEDALLIPFDINTIYENGDLAAPPASGSWPVDGMVICPCSMNTMSAISVGLASNLIQRAALVALKEKRPLVICPRETPLGLIQIRAMGNIAEAGGIIMPFIPTFYTMDATMKGAMRQFCGHILNMFKIPNTMQKNWAEVKNYGTTVL